MANKKYSVRPRKRPLDYMNICKRSIYIISRVVKRRVSMKLEEILQNLKETSEYNTQAGKVAKTLLNYIENMERELVNRNNDLLKILGGN